MEKKRIPPSEVSFEYDIPEDYQIEFVNGVFGGISPRGDIICHFFLERSEIPKEERFRILEDGKIGELLERKPSDEPKKILRELKIGLVLSPQQAASIAQWLAEKAALVGQDVKIKLGADE